MDVLPKIFVVILHDDGQLLEITTRDLDTYLQQGSAAYAVRNLITNFSKTVISTGKAQTLDLVAITKLIDDSPYLTDEQRVEYGQLIGERGVLDPVQYSHASDLPGYQPPLMRRASDAPSGPSYVPIIYFIDP